MEAGYIDIHTHQNADGYGNKIVLNCWYGQELPLQALRMSVGLHPWYLEGINFIAARTWLTAQVKHPEVVAVGEAGLDKLTATPWVIQLEAFQLCIEVARQCGKPLIIHCVRAFEEILYYLEKAPGGAFTGAIFHGFDKHPNVAQRILAKGHYLSFGAALLRPNSHAADALRQTPESRFFLETDTGAISIAAIYERAAAVRDISVDHLKITLEHNYQTLFR